MNSRSRLFLLIQAIFAIWAASFPARIEAELKVVTSFSDYAQIAQFVGGERVDVDFISHGDQDPHFVAPKPSLALKLKDADIWVCTGLDLEMWAPTLLDKAHNGKVMDGARGFVTVQNGIELLQKHEIAMTRTEGDIHQYGNPHIHTGPLNWKIIAENILIGLIRNDPDGEQYFRENYITFCDSVDRALFGPELVEMFGGDRLIGMLKSGGLFDFLKKDYKGIPLKSLLGGWLAKASPLRGSRIIAYHKNWIYFTDTFGFEIVDYIEHKPGIPPTSRHVREIIELIEQQNIKLMLVASYFERGTPQMIEQRTGIKAVFLPFSCGGNEYVPDNFSLIEYWLDRMLEAVSPVSN